VLKYIVFHPDFVKIFVTTIKGFDMDNAAPDPFSMKKNVRDDIRSIIKILLKFSVTKIIMILLFCDLLYPFVQTADVTVMNVKTHLF